ncbi:MAG: hypothetical protein H0W50_03250 [Parachlamydiaceae bacterium]|nr:hypothetical protein [Parachlamydiaceae bacterium]
MNAQDIAKEFRKQLRSGMRTSTIFAMSLAGCLLVSGTSDGSATRSNALAKTNGFSFNASENLLDDDEDDYRVKGLKEHNLKQAHKIRLLRQELAEKTQSVYEIKSQLFKQVGDPRDKEKIATLNQALSANEEVMDELKLEIQERERTTAKLEKAIADLEKTRAQEFDNLKHQIEDLKRAAELNHGDFEKRGRVLETTQLHLSEALENKTIQIASLEHELSKQQLAYIAKSNELKEAVENFSVKEAKSKRLISDLRANLETENSKKIATKTKLKNTVEEKNTLVGSLQQEIENFKHQYELAAVEFTAHKKNAEASTNRDLEYLQEQHRQVKDENNLKVAELTEALDEANETSKQLHAWLYAEMVLHSNQKDKAEELAQTSADKQKRAEALELSLNSLVAEVTRLETALKEMQDSTWENAIALETTQKNSFSLQQRLDDQAKQKNSLSEALLEKEEQLSALEETLRNFVLNLELLEIALASSKELVSSNSQDITRLEDNSSYLQKKLEEEIDQKTKLAEALGVEKRSIIALNAQFSESKKQFESQMQDELGTHKALTGALLEQERRAAALDEALLVKASDVERLENDLLHAKGLIEANILALNESKKVEDDLNEAQGIIFNSYIALIESQEGAQALQNKIDEEIDQRKTAELVLREREAQEYIFNETIANLRKDIVKFENALAASQKLLEENAIALNVSGDRIKMLELRIEGEKDQRLILSDALLEKQEHTIALENTLKAQVKDVDLLENALAGAHETIEKQVLAMSQFEKSVEESHKIILNNYASLNDSELSVRALQAKLEGEQALKLAAEQILQEKDVQAGALALAIQTLTLDAERYENALSEAQKYINDNSSALNEIKEEVTFLEKRLDVEKSKQLVLIEALEEKQKHVAALEVTLNAQIVDADRLHTALSDAKGIIENHLVVMEESKKIESELEKAQVALAKHQDLLFEQQQVIDSYDKREQH